MSNQTLYEYCSVLRTELDLISDANATLMLLSNHTKDFWKSPRGTVIRIEVLVVVAVFLQLFLVACGSRRRRSTSFFIQKGVLGAYTLSSSLVSYTLGSMQSSAIKNSMYSMWAISLYILFGCADSITAYSLTDNSQLTRQLYQSVLGMLYVSMIMGATLNLESNIAAIRLLPLFYLVSVAATYFLQRLGACRMASGSWFLNKVVADYMYQEHTMSGADYDPATMTGYHYLVECSVGPAYIGHGTYVTQFRTGPSESDPIIIDLDKVWRNEDLSPDLKDACLSFSLFHLLRRRFFGFECGESSQPKTSDLVFKGMLAKKEENDGPGASAAIDYDWIFKVIEIELAFMYDFFFTKYAAIYYGGFVMRYLLPLVSAILTVVTACLTVAGLLQPPSKGMADLVGSVIVNTKAVDVDLTVAILVCISFLQVVQVMYYWTTIWGRVSFVCQRIKREGCCMKLKETLVNIGLWVSTCRCRWWWHHHEQKLGQYSVLKSMSNFSSQCMLTKVLVMYENIFLNLFSFMEGWVLRPPVSDHVWSIIRKPGKPAELSAAIKKALVQSLERTRRDGNSKLTNGVLSLSSSRAYDELKWACNLGIGQDLKLGSVSLQKKENQVFVILTWHIATCYCEKELPASGSAITGEELKENYEVATTLSKYCAYLVAFAPKLLPGHHYDTWLAFKWAIDVALRQQQSPEDRNEDTTYRMGLRLGEQLKNLQADHCWEVLAGFWAEMLIYVAPSDNVKEHIECLRKGGEFITHLWALLTHAGILDRGQRNADDVENNGGNQPAPRPTSVQSAGMEPQQERIVQIVEGAPDACSASNEIIVIES